MVKKVETVDTRLSSSSATAMRGCEQKWYHYKVAKSDKDPDHEESNAFIVGKAFHYIIEKTNHEAPKKILPLLKECSEHEDIGLKKEDYPLLIGMVHSYCELHKKMGLSVVACEEELSDEEFIGYVDAILKDDKTGQWWIEDNKTYANFSPSNAAGWGNHVQLNLYAYFAPVLAKKYKLNIKKFAGCRIRVTTKPRIKQKAKESLKDLANRFKETCASYDVEIPIGIMNPEHHMQEHKYLHQRSLELWNGHDTPIKNYDNCFSYFKPCEYWSKCHRDTHSRCEMKVKVTCA